MIRVGLSVFALVSLVPSAFAYEPFSVVVGNDGPPPLVQGFSADFPGGAPLGLVAAPTFTGGVSVAFGDVNGDGFRDLVTGLGPGAPGVVEVRSGASGGTVLLNNFLAFGPTPFLGGVTVAAGDVNNDGKADIVVGQRAGGTPRISIFQGGGAPFGQQPALLNSFFAFSSGFSGGVNVAAGDVNGDGIADVITGAGTGGAGHVKVFDGMTGGELRSFFAFGGGFTGGVFVAAGDVNGDDAADIITGASNAPHLKVFDGRTNSQLASFFAFSGFSGGVSVSAGDWDGDGLADIVGAPGTPGGPSKIEIYELQGTSPLLLDTRFFSPTGSGAPLTASPFGFSVAGYAPFTATPIPEPQSYALLLAGLGLLGWRWCKSTKTRTKR